MRVEIIMTTQLFYGYQAMIRLDGNVIRAGECVADPAEAASEGNSILAEYGGNGQEGLPW